MPAPARTPAVPGVWMPLPLLTGDEPRDGSVVRALHVVREVACRQLASAAVVLDALTAPALARARLVAAVAVLHVCTETRALFHAACVLDRGLQPQDLRP